MTLHNRSIERHRTALRFFSWVCGSAMATALKDPLVDVEVGAESSEVTWPGDFSPTRFTQRILTQLLEEPPVSQGHPEVCTQPSHRRHRQTGRTLGERHEPRNTAKYSHPNKRSFADRRVVCESNTRFTYTYRRRHGWAPLKKNLAPKYGVGRETLQKRYK